MPEDTIQFGDKTFEIKRKLNFGEVRRAQRSAGNLVGMDERIKNAKSEDYARIALEINKSSDEQMQIVEDTLRECLGEDANVMGYEDAIILFNEVIKHSTAVKKKLGQQYA